MSKTTQENLASVIKSSGRLPDEIVLALRKQQARSRELNKKAHAPILNQVIAGMSSNFGPRRLVPRLTAFNQPGPGPGDTPMPLMCLPGFSSLASQVPSFPYGSDETPRFGPLVEPQPAGALPEYPCHKYSVQTTAAAGGISLALGLDLGEPGYGPEERINDVPALSVSASLTDSFYLPGVNKDISVLQATSRVTADHGLRESIVLFNSALPTVGTSAVLSIATTSIVQGLGFLFGDYDPASRSSSSAAIVQMQQTNGTITTDYSPIDDIGNVDMSTLLKYDQFSDIFFIETEITVYGFLCNGDQSNNVAGADFRFAEDKQDNRLMVWPDDASYSCGFEVLETMLCAY